MNKKYSKESLYEWFRRYKKEWASIYFDEREAVDGHKYYEERVIKDIDIGKNIIIASGKVLSDTYFTTIEFIDSKLCISYSHGNDVIGRALAFAALLITDDIIFENLSWLGIEPPDIVEERSVIKTKAERNRAQIGKLVFSKKGQQLCFELYFLREGNFISAELLGGTLRPNERESLMSIIHFGKKYGFTRNFYTFYSNDITSFNEIICFKLQELEEFFSIELSEDVSKLANDINVAKLSIDFLKNGMQHNVVVGNKFLDHDEFVEIQKARKIYWSKSHGLVKIDANDVNWLHRISKIEAEIKANPPLYLALSIFRPEKVFFSENIQNWIKNLQIADNENIDMPNFLYNYQKKGVLWMYHLIKNGCNPLIADEMGLGKTIQVLALLNSIDKSNGSIDLIVCPASVVSVWQNEIAKFFPHFNVFGQKDTDCITENSKNIIIISYAQLRAFEKTKKTFRTIVLDEAQYIKNPKSKTANICFSLKSDYKIAITGTPLENKYDDIWSIFNFLMPFLLGKYSEFKKLMLDDNAMNKLSIQLAPFILRRNKESVLLDLPNKNETIVLCRMSEAQSAKYNKWLSWKNNIKTGEWSHLFALILRLRQICCDIGMLPNNEHENIMLSAKIQWLIPKLNECRQNNSKIVIFSQFKKYLDRLIPLVQKIYENTYSLNGTTPQIKRKSIIKNFQSDNIAALLLTTKTGGTGITLNSANIVFILDPWWNPAAEAQAIDRLHRIGQKNNVFIYKLITPNSIEEKVQYAKSLKINYLTSLFSKTSNTKIENKWSELLNLLT